MKKYDVIIVGSGLAGLATAIRLYELGKKNIGIYALGYGGTPYIAAINFVTPENPYGDTPKQYCEDMLNAGYQINNKELVEGMTEATLDGYELLSRWGVEFSKNGDGKNKLRHLSGHTFPRSLCCTTELIGVEITKILTKALQDKGIEIHLGNECVGLLSEEDTVYGIQVKNKNGVENIYGNNVVAAWGGVGNILGKSTYPKDVRGNTLSIANKAGAKLVDLEFLEYEPMVVLSPEGAVGEPCPTAMLGEGAHLLNTKGERFLLNVRPQGEAGASKTLINKEIWKQVEEGNGTQNKGAWVDLRHINKDVLKGYPWFYNRLMENGVDPNKELVEIGPMAHSFSGGVLVDKNYESTLKGFFAVGEACGGVHGACRCAGNAASQATLSGLLCANAINELGRVAPEKQFPIDYCEDKEVFETYSTKAKDIAVNALGVYRNGKDLEKGKKDLEEIAIDEQVKKDTYTEQIVDSIALMIDSALKREESIGSHMRTDFPQKQ